jgi:hypothetical protein
VRVTSDMTNFGTNRDQQLARLRQEYPSWYIWYVLRLDGHTAWCAGKPSSMVAAFLAFSPEELDQDLRESETGQGARLWP